jgi:predicted Zn-dependent protease
LDLSEQPEYQLAIPAAVKGDYETASNNLRALIARASDEGDLLNTAFLLHVLGDVEAKSGHEDKGHALHAQAIELHAGQPLPHLMYAEGLLRAFKRPDLAMQELHRLREILDAGKLETGANEQTIEWYESEYESLGKQVKSQLS